MSKELEPQSLKNLDMLGDPKDPMSLRNMIPEFMVHAYRDIPDELHAMTEGGLKRKLNKHCIHTVLRLRHSFWAAYDFAKAGGRKLSVGMIHKGVTTSQNLKYLCEKPENVAMILRPPQSYAIMLQEALDASVHELRDILDQPHINEKTGMLDPKIADVKRRLFENLSDRVKGMPVQRTENLNYNKDVPGGQSFGDAAGGGMPTSEELDKKLKDLEKELGQASADEAKDVTPK